MTEALMPALAKLLRYPDAGYLEDVHLACQTLPDADRDLRRFAEQVSGQSVGQLQELFTQTFDMSKTCALEVGWHLYGEDYERGRFLATMRGLLRDHSIPESTELPDHLSHLLLLLDRLPATRREELIRTAILPALGKMKKGVDEKAVPYTHLMNCIYARLGIISESASTGGDHE